MTVLAEGIETSAIADQLEGLNCDDLQGYWIARPMVAADVMPWATDHASTLHPTSPVIMQSPHPLAL